MKQECIITGPPGSFRIKHDQQKQHFWPIEKHNTTVHEGTNKVFILHLNLKSHCTLRIKKTSMESLEISGLVGHT